MIVAHRRAGKTVAAVQKLFKEATTHKRKGPPLRYAYIAPTRDQAKDIAWGYIKAYASKIPDTEINESELRVTLPNKAQIRLYSGENYERMRGLYMDGVVSDEDADIPPAAFDYVIIHCLADYNGWHVRMGTPKGKNSFYDAFQEGERDEDVMSVMVKASESGILSQDTLDVIRHKIGEDAYQQEMECDFNVGRPGSIYADLMAQAWLANSPERVFEFEVDPEVPVYTTWDLGGPENTVVIYWQRVGFQHRIIDCDHFGKLGGRKLSTSERVAHMNGKGYNYGGHFVPHDSKATEKDGMSFEEKLKKAGLYGVRAIPRSDGMAEERRIRAMSDIFPTIFFRKQELDDKGGLIEALENYHRKIDQKTNRVSEKIVHDWTSHFADAFGYYAEAAKHGFFGRDSLGPRPTVARTDARAPGYRGGRRANSAIM